jgi:hypothetical protein
MTQTRLGSLIESLFNIVIGIGISLVANAMVFPHFGFRPSIAQNAGISGIYTVISIVRSYVLRRFFNARLKAAAERLAGVRA